MDKDPLWYKNAVFYELHVRTFADSNGDGQGDLPGLISKLDYLQDLGVTCLWLLPIFRSPLKDDGYDVADFYRIHPDYGDVDDFHNLLDVAHARGIRVITDLVLNHTSDQHPWFRRSRSSKDNPFRNYYVWTDNDQKYSQARIIFLDSERSNWTYDPLTGEYYWHRFFSNQPDLNYDNPVVADRMINVIRFWLDMGLDGFRVDAVPYLFEREDSNGENLPETHAYIKTIRSVIDREYPGTILLAEANQWPQDLRPYFGGDPEDPSVAGDEFHMAFHFPIMPRIFKSIKQGDATDIINIMAATPPIPNNCQWCIFLRNHDELTLEMVTEADRQFLWEAYAPEPIMRLNLGIRRRLAPLLDYDRRKIELANALLFTLPGAPIIYYGDEIGMGDNIELFDRRGVRTPMQWHAGPGAGFSSAQPEQFCQPIINGGPCCHTRVNVAAQQTDPTSLLQTMKRMIAARRTNPAFGEHHYEFLATGNRAVLANLRRNDGPPVLALYNLSDQAQQAVLNLAEFAGVLPYDLLDHPSPLPRLTHHPQPISLAPYEYYWLKLEKDRL